MRPVKYRFGSYVLTGLTAPAMEAQVAAEGSLRRSFRARQRYVPSGQKEKPPGRDRIEAHPRGWCAVVLVGHTALGCSHSRVKGQ